MNQVLANISSANLDILDRDMLTFWIHVDYEDGCSQGIGGFALDEWDEKKKRRIGTAYGCEMIICLLKLFKVNSLEALKGRTVFVLGDGEGLNFKPRGIKMLRSDGGKELIFTDVAKEML